MVKLKRRESAIDIYVFSPVIPYIIKECFQGPKLWVNLCVAYDSVDSVFFY